MNQQDRCGVARDLMPLAVDGVCSEGSQRFLEEHIGECGPCRDMFTQMRAGDLPEMTVESAGDAQALSRGLRWLGRRFRALWIALAALAGAFVLLLIAAGINQIVWNWQSDIPLDQVSVRIHHTSPIVSITMSGQFLAQDYLGHQLDIQTIDDTADNQTGQPQSVILTYTLRYYPRKAAESARLLPDYRYTSGLTELLELCSDGERIYLVGGMEGTTPPDGKHLILLDTGLPVSEIRVKAGRDMRTIYTSGDPIDTTPQALDENGLPTSRTMLRKDYEAWLDAAE